MPDSKIVGAIESVIRRAFERETIATGVALYFVYTGRVQTMEEAVALVGTIVTLVTGRSWVKARRGSGDVQ